MITEPGKPKNGGHVRSSENGRPRLLRRRIKTYALHIGIGGRNRGQTEDPRYPEVDKKLGLAIRGAPGSPCSLMMHRSLRKQEPAMVWPPHVFFRQGG